MDERKTKTTEEKFDEFVSPTNLGEDHVPNEEQHIPE